MKVEVCRCWADGTWDTEMIELNGELDRFFNDSDYPDFYSIDSAIREYYDAKAIGGIEVPAFTSIYHIPEQEGVE